MGLWAGIVRGPSSVESKGQVRKGWPWASSTPGQGVTLEVEPLFAWGGGGGNTGWTRACPAAKGKEWRPQLTQPERAWYPDGPGASPGTCVQRVQPDSQNKDRGAQDGLRPGGKFWGPSPRVDWLDILTAVAPGLILGHGDRPGSHRELLSRLLSLGLRLMWPSLCSALLGPVPCHPSSPWSWCGRSSEPQSQLSEGSGPNPQFPERLDWPPWEGWLALAQMAVRK